MPTGIDLRRLVGASLAVLTLGFTVTACGGGDDEEQAAPATATTGATEPVELTTAALIEEGDAICAEVNAALGSIAASTADETTKSSQVTDIYDDLAQRLGELGTPSDGEAPTDVIAAVRDLAEGSTDTTAFTTAAGEYGFNDCAEEPEAVTYSPGSTGTDTGTDSSSTGTAPTETYTPPATDSTETYTPPPADPAPTTGGGVAPTPPATGGSGGGSSGGTSSGGIGPG